MSAKRGSWPHVELEISNPNAKNVPRSCFTSRPTWRKGREMQRSKNLRDLLINNVALPRGRGGLGKKRKVAHEGSGVCWQSFPQTLQLFVITLGISSMSLSRRSFIKRSALANSAVLAAATLPLSQAAGETGNRKT